MWIQLFQALLLSFNHYFLYIRFSELHLRLLVDASILAQVNGHFVPETVQDALLATVGFLTESAVATDHLIGFGRSQV